MSRLLSLAFMAACGSLPLEISHYSPPHGPRVPWMPDASANSSPDSGLCYQQLTDIVLVLDDSLCDGSLPQFEAAQQNAMDYVLQHEGAAYRYAVVNVPGCGSNWPGQTDGGYELLQDLSDGAQTVETLGFECATSACHSVAAADVRPVMSWDLGAGRVTVVVGADTDLGAEIVVATSCE